MQKKLPERPSLEHLKSQAKDLLAAFRRNDASAAQRFHDALPAARARSLDEIATHELALHDAQSVIAREYGFQSWSSLRDHVESRARTPSLETLRALMSSPLPQEVETSLQHAASLDTSVPFSLPPTLPVVPLRNAVLSVGSVAPLSIGRPSSIAAVQAAQAASGLLAVFSQKAEASEAPQAADLHPVGCAARLCSVLELGERGRWIVLGALEWIALERIESTAPHIVACISRFAVDEGEPARVQALDAALRERVLCLTARLPEAEPLLRRIRSMSARELADATIANLPCSVDEKARYASERSLTARLEYVLSLVERAA
jgi:Lon protease-like protein